jgi:ribosomal protein S18 acetylase RimI-like enzyme
MLLRTAEPGDADEVAGVHVRSWQVGYRGLLPDDYLDSLRPEDRAKRYTFAAADPTLPSTILAIDNGAICGFATTAPTRDEDVPGHGELCALYVDPSCWSLGVGRALMSAARERLAHDGFADAVLWVLVGNERAERFYRLDGWLPDGSRRLAEVWSAAVNEARFRRHLA